MVPNRRQFSRRSTQSLVFVTVDETNGGIPCNLARGGVALGLVQPVTEHQIVTLGFARRGINDRIEVAAEAAWIDHSGTNAGFRFLNMPQSSYQGIENWITADGNGHQKSAASQMAAGNIPSCAPSESGSSVPENPLPHDGGPAASGSGRSSLLSQCATEQELESERFEISAAFAQAESTNFRDVGHGKTTVGAEKSSYTIEDALGGWRSVLDTATVTSEEADTTERSSRIRLRVAEALDNPFVRRKLIVNSLWALALIALAVVCFLLVRFHRELISPAAWSGAIRELLRANDVTSFREPKPASSVVAVKKRPSRHDGRSAGRSAAQSAAAKNAKDGSGAIPTDTLISSASDVTRSNHDAEFSDRFPAITIVSSRYVPQSLSAAVIGHSRILLTPIDAGAFLVSQEISGNLPEGRPLLTYPASAREKKLEGFVTVRAAINQDGSVRSVRLVSGDPLLASAVLEAVEQWRYKPWNDGPAETEALITVKFTVSTK